MRLSDSFEKWRIAGTFATSQARQGIEDGFAIEPCESPLTYVNGLRYMHPTV